MPPVILNVKNSKSRFFSILAFQDSQATDICMWQRKGANDPSISPVIFDLTWKKVASTKLLLECVLFEVDKLLAGFQENTVPEKGPFVVACPPAQQDTEKHQPLECKWT